VPLSETLPGVLPFLVSDFVRIGLIWRPRHRALAGRFMVDDATKGCHGGNTAISPLELLFFIWDLT